MFVFGGFWNLNGPLPVKSLSTAEGDGSPTEPARPWRKSPTPRPVLQRYVKTAQKSCQAAFHQRASASQCHERALWVPKGRSQKWPPSALPKLAAGSCQQRLWQEKLLADTLCVFSPKSPLPSTFSLEPRLRPKMVEFLVFPAIYRS